MVDLVGDLGQLVATVVDGARELTLGPLMLLSVVLVIG